MAVQRKDAQELKHRGPNQVRPENNVDPGISASQAVPVLLDYYSVRFCFFLLKSLKSWIGSDFVHGTRWMLRVRPREMMQTSSKCQQECLGLRTTIND